MGFFKGFFISKAAGWAYSSGTKGAKIYFYVWLGLIILAIASIFLVNPDTDSLPDYATLWRAVSSTGSELANEGAEFYDVVRINIQVLNDLRDTVTNVQAFDLRLLTDGSDTFYNPYSDTEEIKSLSNLLPYYGSYLLRAVSVIPQLLQHFLDLGVTFTVLVISFLSYFLGSILRIIDLPFKLLD